MTGSKRTVRIGLTGPIGCGKSTIAGWLRDLGAAVVDADALAREVTGPGEAALGLIAARFGDSVMRLDGTLDRPALGRIVFGDPAALRALEAIVHPAVRPRILAAIAAAEGSGAPAVVIEAIKLVEAGYASSCDEVWLVTCDREAQRRRLAGRGFPPADVDQRLAAQAGLEGRVATAATLVIDTTGSAADARRRVEAAYRHALETRR